MECSTKKGHMSRKKTQWNLKEGSIFQNKTILWKKCQENNG